VKRLALIALLLTAACSGSQDATTSDDNTPTPTDIHKDWVEINGYDQAYKTCDGTTMLYEVGGAGMSAVPDAPECSDGGNGYQPSPPNFGTPTPTHSPFGSVE
jgi:hypothetical protein